MAIKPNHTYHMCLDIAGALTWNKKELKGMFHNPQTGGILSPDEARQYLMDRLKEGKTVIPICPCDNFDYQHGCMGHPNTAAEAGSDGEQ